MEGKAVLFQTLAGVEAFPICLAARDPDEIVEIVANISPSFGGINLEDIAAPRCFEIEAQAAASASTCRSSTTTSTARRSSSLAALLNALQAARHAASRTCRSTINGAGAAGIAVTKLLLVLGVGDVVLCDRAGAIYEARAERMESLEGGDRRV